MAKSKRDEKAEEASGDYEFKLPPFDEKAFIRREVQGAKASFYTVALGFAAGILSTVVSLLVDPSAWMLGWIPILGTMALLRPILQKLGFSEEAVAWKALFGSFFMLFFTGLAVWIIGVNLG